MNNSFDFQVCVNEVHGGVPGILADNQQEFILGSLDRLHLRFVCGRPDGSVVGKYPPDTSFVQSDFLSLRCSSIRTNEGQ